MSRLRKLYQLTGSILSVFVFLNSVSAQTPTTNQRKRSEFVLLAGRNSPGSVNISSSGTINGGSIGAFKLIQTSSSVIINSNIYSADKIIIGSSNTITGNLSAAANYPNTPSSGNILSVGSSSVNGNADVYGNVSFGGTITGKITIPSGATFSPSSLGSKIVRGAPNLQIPPSVAPDLPEPYVIDNTTYPVNTTPITTNVSPGPGSSNGNINYSGNKKLTLLRPGVYVFNSIKMTGSSNDLVFDFDNKPGIYQVYIRGNADFGKLNVTFPRGGDASRVYMEVLGDGTGTSISGNSFLISNGSAGGASKWQGTVYAPNGGINIGSGTGSSSFTGAFWSRKSITIQSGVTVTYSALKECNPLDVIAGIGVPVIPIDTIPLDFTGHTTLGAKSASGTPGMLFSWQAAKGGIITSTNTDAATIVVESQGDYIVSAYMQNNIACVSRDTVVVTASTNDIIGGELFSIYQNYNSNTLRQLDPFFVLTPLAVPNPEFVKIDVIAIEGKEADALAALESLGFVESVNYSNGNSLFTFTGDLPIVNIPEVIELGAVIKYCRPYYKPILFRDFQPGDTLKKTGLVVSAGDTTIGTYLVRKGYQLDGDEIKIGVLSDSYETIEDGTTEPVKTTDSQHDIRNGELPGMTSETVDLVPPPLPNPNGFLKDVHVVKDFEDAVLTDEGRAMLQIIHDVAPRAELYFRTGFYTAGDLAAGIDELASLGCDIIVDDLTYIAEPSMKDGVVATAVNNAKNNGVAYFTSAGNFGTKGYEKDFVSTLSTLFPGKRVHNFSTSGEDLFQQVKLKPGSYILAMQWVDDIYSIGETNGTNLDLDIFLTKSENGTGLIGFNRNNLFGDPFEFIPITIGGSTDVLYNIVIVNNTPDRGTPSRVKYVFYKGDALIMEHNASNSTITGHANAAGAITVGAARFNHIPGHPLLPDSLAGITKPRIESFSSRGGTMGIEKPDLVGPDGVNTTVNLGPDFLGLDGYSNFFGTSAAAPHVAGAAALILQARKRFFPTESTTPDQLKQMLKSQARDMRPAGLTGYDFASGAGLVDADALMRTIANPTPFQIKLNVPNDKVPGTEEFLLTITGENFTTNTVVKMINNGDTITLIPTSIDVENGVLQVLIPPFSGNPEIKAFTEGKTDYDDGGHSNGKRFFVDKVVVRAADLTKKYGENVPDLQTIVTINGILLSETNPLLTLADLGLDEMVVQTAATASSDVGPVPITVSRVFDPITDAELLSKYEYQFFNGELKIEPLPLTITVLDPPEVGYGAQIPNIQFDYDFDETNIPDPGAFLNEIKSQHNAQLAKDPQGHDILGLVNAKALTIVNAKALTIVNGQEVTQDANGQYNTTVDGVSYPVVNAKALTIVNNIVTDTTPINLTPAEIENLSFLATQATLQNSRQITNTSGTTSVVDIAQESLINFNLNGAQTLMLGAASDEAAKGVVDQESYTNAKALTIVNAKALTIVNGEEFLDANGDPAIIKNRQALTIVNGEEVPAVYSNNRTAVILEETEIGDGVSTLKSLNVVTGLTAGNHTILPGALNNGNYLRTYVSGKLKISQVPLQVIADNKSRKYGEENPPLTVSYSGFVNGETLQTSDIIGSPVVSTTAKPTSPVSPPTYPISVAKGTLSSSNYSFSFVSGSLTVTNNQCLQVHSPFTNFGNTAGSTSNPPKKTSLWFNLVTKVSGQLSQPGDYLLFKSGTLSLNSIGWTPVPSASGIPDTVLPSGKIIAVDPSLVPNGPVTSYDESTNTWITQVRAGFTSTSDVFVTGAIINSSTGFKKLNANTNTVLRGVFVSTKPFSDQWAYAIAAYQVPTSQGGPYVTYPMIKNPGNVASINGPVNGTNYRAGTPIPIISYLVQGASGGGGNNYTGSTSSFNNFTVSGDCIVAPETITMRRDNPSGLAEVEVIEEANPGGVVVINPNPASGYFNISFIPLQNGNAKMELYTLNGEKVLESNYGMCQAGKSYVKKVDVSNLLVGIYVVRLLNAGNATSQKVVIVR